MHGLKDFLAAHALPADGYIYPLNELDWRRMQSFLVGQEASFLGLYCDGVKVYAFFVDDGRPLVASCPLDNQRYPGISRVLPVATFYERFIYDLWGAEALWAQDEKSIIDRKCWSTLKPFSATALQNPHWQQPPQSETPYERNGFFSCFIGNGFSPLRVEGQLQNGCLQKGHLIHGYVHRGLLKRCRGARIRDVWYLVGRSVAGQSAAHQLAFAHAVEAICALEVPDDVRILRKVFIELERVLTHLYRLMMIAKLLDIQTLVTKSMIFREQLLSSLQDVVHSRLLMDVCAPGGINVKQISRLESQFFDMSLVSKAFEKNFVKSWLNYPGLCERLAGIGRIPDKNIIQSGISGPLYKAIMFKREKTFQRSETSLLDRTWLMLIEIFRSLQSIELSASQTSTLDVPNQLPTYDVATGSCLSWVDGEWGRVAYWVRTDEGRVQDIFCHSPAIVSSQLCEESLKDVPIEDLNLALASFGVTSYGFDG